METKQLTPEMVAALKAPLPPEAISQHPTRKYLSTIKPAFVVERLNEVFGVAGWFAESRIVEAGERMIVAETTLTVPEYGIVKNSFGGNDNEDRGDAYKGAVTDGLTKCAFYLGIGMDVYKHANKDAPAAVAKAQARSGIKPTPSPEAPATKGPAPQPASNQASAGDPSLLTLNISEVTKETTRGGKPYLWVRDGRKSVACFKPELYDAINGQVGENVTFRVEQGSKGPHIVGIWQPPPAQTLEINEGDIPF